MQKLIQRSEELSHRITAGADETCGNAAKALRDLEANANMIARALEQAIDHEQYHLKYPSATSGVVNDAIEALAIYRAKFSAPLRSA